MIAPHFEEYALHLANAMARTVPVRLFVNRRVLERDFEGRSMPLADGVTLAHIDFSRPRSVVQILAGLISFRPSVLHIQEPSGRAKAIIATIMVTLFVPFCTVALTVHDPEPHVGRDSAIVAQFARLRRYIRRRSHLVFVHGPYCRAVYRLRSSRADQDVLLTDHGAILQGEGLVNIPAGPIRLLAFGRMEQYKGLDVLCTAAERMRAAGTPFRLTVAGHGPELDRLEPRLRVMGEVTVRNGFIPSADLIGAIRASDCVVLPYLEATQSGVLAAAFANGRFVVASDVGGIPNVAVHGENGLLVPAGDAEALAAALTRVARDPALRDWLSLGTRDTAARRLDWGPIADRMLADYVS